jgi:protein SCO1/2
MPLTGILKHTARRRGSFRWMSIALACGLFGICGCHSHSNRGASNTSASSSQKQYSVRGKVISVDAKDGVISLDTDAIPGFMEAMTMAYTLANPSEASELHPGDLITAKLQITGQGAVLSDINVIQHANPNIKPVVQYHIPQPGDAVPNFKLRNQSDRQIRLDQFRDNVFFLTFLHTRYPSSTFCPLMSRNFAKLNANSAPIPG